MLLLFLSMLVTQRVNKLFLCKKNLGKSHVITHPCNLTVAYGIMDNATAVEEEASSFPPLLNFLVTSNDGFRCCF